MATFPLLISFFTLDTDYEKEVQNLIASCKKFGVEHHIEGVPSFGSWELNCAYKPFFIHQKLREFKRPLFWLDADAIFVKRPEPLLLFDQSDFSVRINESLPRDHPSYVISGSMFLNYTPQAGELVRLWAKECRKQLSDPLRKTEFWDQIALRDVLLLREHSARVEPMPGEYTKIAGHFFDEIDIPEPIIEHYQASRRFKKTI